MMCEGIKKLNKSGFIFHGISFIINVYRIRSEAVQNAPHEKTYGKIKQFSVIDILLLKKQNILFMTGIM